MEKTEKLTFGEWVENVWYRYKWPIIIIGLIVVFAFIALIQQLSVDDPDVTVLYVGPEYLTQTARENVYESFTLLADDHDGDGKVSTDILDITLKRYYDIEDEDKYGVYDQNNEAIKRFQIEIRSGDAVIYILDKTYFDECMELGILAPLAEVMDESDIPASNISGYGVELGKIEAKTLPGFDALPEDMILAIRRSPTNDVISYGRDEDFWENNRKAFENLIKYRR